MKNLICLIVVIFLSSCSVNRNYSSVPNEYLDQVVINGYPKKIRFWADEIPKYGEVAIKERIRQYKEENQKEFEETGQYPELHYLAISGGGDAGAFGAGVLNGWTFSEKRKSFAIVTGVSTGAIIAPFAFLGPEYDELIKRSYLESSTDTILKQNIWTVLSGLIGKSASISDASLFKKKLNELITRELIRKIAIEHQKGRRLFIGTTNIEAQRGVIWDIGEIAMQDNEKSLELIRNIIQASSAIPGIFDPVLINVQIDDNHYTEIHVDGGVTSQLIIYPLKLRKSVVDEFRDNNLKRRLFVIRNAKVTGEFNKTLPSVIELTQRSIETLIKYHGVGDLIRIYVSSIRDGIDYNLIYIPDHFSHESKELFDPLLMEALFDLGLTMGKDNNSWLKSPPGVEYLTD